MVHMHEMKDVARVKCANAEHHHARNNVVWCGTPSHRYFGTVGRDGPEKTFLMVSSDRSTPFDERNISVRAFELRPKINRVRKIYIKSKWPPS